MLKKKSKVFIKKRIDNLLQQKKVNFRLIKILEQFKIFEALNNASILIFFQYLSLNGEIDNKFFQILIDKDFFYFFIKKIYIKKFFNHDVKKKFISFNNVVSFNNLLKINDIIFFFQEMNVLISGYYFNKIYFSKEDLNINNIQINTVFNKFFQLKNYCKNFIIKIIFILKYCLNKNKWLL